MQFEFYQWVVPLVGLFYLVRVTLQFRANERSATSLVVWLIFWVTIIVLAVIPNPISFKIAKLLGFKSNINAVIFVALGWLFLIVFYLSSSIDRLDKQLTKIVREMALDKAEEKKEKDQDDEKQKQKNG